MRLMLLLAGLLLSQVSWAQQETGQTSAPAPQHTDFHVRYVNGDSVYIDGGRDAGLSEGTNLVLKQSVSADADAARNKALEPGIIAKLTVVSVASTSAVCQVNATTRDMAVGDTLSLPDAEVEKMVENQTLGNTRIYPMVVSFTEGDPLDEEVRESIPAPPLPEVNQSRGRVGFQISTIRGQEGSTSSTYGMVVRADMTRIGGSHWNLLGYWVGTLERGSTASQPTLQDLINRTYEISLTYVNPSSPWSMGIGRLYLPWAPSLDVIDGGYVAHNLGEHSVFGVFGGSTPDPAAWNYSPNRQVAGTFLNFHGGSFDSFRFSSTFGGGVNLLSWTINRPFGFTENDFSFKHIFNIYHSMQIDQPTPNPSSPTVSLGIGQSLLSVNAQVHPRVSLELTHTYFRDVPTYDAALVGTGLLNAYLFQGINGGARVQFPMHVTGYFSGGKSSTSTDSGDSLNLMGGVTVGHIWKTGLDVDVQRSRFNSSFATGSYDTLTISRNLGERLRLNAQGGKQAYTSPIANASSPYFANIFLETNLGSHYFMQSAYTTQRGGTQDYDQYTTTIGFRFDNRSRIRRMEHAAIR